MLFVDYFIAPHSQRGPKDLLENKMLSATEATLESVRNLITCSENIRERLTSEFKDTLHDWASAKSGNDIKIINFGRTFVTALYVWLVFVDMERLIEVEKEKVRNDLGAKIAKLGDDLVLKQNMYERKCDQMDVLEGHISDLKLVLFKSFCFLIPLKIIHLPILFRWYGSWPKPRRSWTLQASIIIYSNYF